MRVFQSWRTNLMEKKMETEVETALMQWFRRIGVSET